MSRQRRKPPSPERQGTLFRIAQGLIMALLVAVPITYLPVSLSMLELPKQTLLVTLSMAATLLWLGGMLATRKLSVRTGLLNAFPAFLLLAILLSAILAPDAYRSFLGTSLQEHASVLTAFALVATFYLTANLFSGERAHRTAHALVLLSAFLAGGLGLLSMLGIDVIPGLASGGVANTVGTANALGGFLCVSAIFGAALWAGDRDGTLLHAGWLGRLEQALVLAVAALAVAVLFVVAYWVLWLVLLAGVAMLFALAFVRMDAFPRGYRLILPAALAAMAIVGLLWIREPVLANVPVEVSPSHEASWTVAASVLSNGGALFGAGPGSFPTSFEHYRPVSLNATPFWDTTFDRGSSFLLTALAEIGVVGTLAWAAFLIAALLVSIRAILRTKSPDDWLSIYADLAGLWALIVLLAFYPANITLLFLAVVMCALVASRAMGERREWSFARNPRIALAASLGAVALALGIVTVIVVSTMRFRAEIAFAHGVRLDREGAPLAEVTSELDRAATLNRFHDGYYRTLAQALLLRLGEELEDGLDEGDADRLAYLRALSNASANAAERATELSRLSARNWRMKGLVYRELSSMIERADEVAISSFARAVELSPASPEGLTELGRSYLSSADLWRQTAGASEDPEEAARASLGAQERLGLAERSFLAAIELKDDHAPAYFQLALTLERQGRLQEAIATMENVAVQSPLDVGVAFQLGLLYLRRDGEGDLERAERALSNAVALAPAYSNARWFLASVYERQERPRDAIAQVSKVLELNPGNALVSARLERLKDGLLQPEIPEILE